MADQSQTYKNHVRWFAPLHFFVLPVLLANALNAIRHVWQNPALSTGFALLVAVAILALGVLSRVMAVTVQDRVVRLEMRLRLGGVLPPDLCSRIPEFTVAQLVSMRFASDAELSALARKVLDEKLKERNTIKRLVKNWKPDFLRV